MSTNHAKTKKRLMLFLVYPGVTLLDVTGPAQVFSTTNSVLESNDSSRCYETIIVSDSGGLITTDTGIEINSAPLDSYKEAEIDTIIVAGGNGVFDAV